MALALYRKYRPRTFAEVIGQEHVTEPLSQALRSGRLNHAYLFSGPRGCGKTSSARILARSLNCDKGPTPDPCGECESCRALAPDGPGSIDVIEIDAASHGGVDDARDLRERAFFAPVASRYKIYVIDEAHMVSPAGFNALLKLVEEPPDYVTFVFATTEPEKVLGTIKSRTHHYPFRLIPPGVLRPYLEELCRREGVSVEPAVFPLVVRAGGGSVRDSLSVLDQLIAGAGADGVTYARAAALLGVTDVALIDEMCDALAAGDGAAAFATIDQVAEAGHDARRFASDLLERLRDLIVLQQVPDAAAKGLLDAPADQLERMGLQAQRFGPATLSRAADIVHNGLVEMRGTTAPRLLLELVTARMLLPGADDSAEALLHRLERMERRLGASTGGPSAPPAAASSAAPSQPSRVRDAAPPDAGQSAVATATQPGMIDAAAVRRVWDEILTMVSRKSKRAAAVVREATVRDVDGDTIVLVFRHGVHAEMLTAAPEVLIEAVYEVLGGEWQIRCEFGGDQRDQARSTPAPTPAATKPAPAPRAPSRPGPPVATDQDWPTPARLGGEAVAPPDPGPPPPAGTKAAKAAPRARRTKQTADEAPPDEPPYDPAYDGFDPGDEPLDVVLDEQAARQTSEHQALQLLQQALGAEKIGEVDHR
jgi:DNA polymerase-3 subunit gamma/tau